ncbi:hypothetical protein AB7V82_20600 [Providencia stuartii]|uniref:hypothetical protein n=1 Tax=Providencia stuartii TaxID=588 RepID=UPI0034E3DB64
MVTEEYRVIDSEVVRKIEQIYDTAVRFCLHRKTFNSEVLCKAFELDPYTCEELITTMSINGVIGDISDDGEYRVSDNYNHSNYLLAEELKKEDKKEDKVKGVTKPTIKLGRYFGFLALVVFVVSVYFLFRSPMSLFIVIPLSLAIVYGGEKIGAVASSIGVIVVCGASIMLVNSASPIFGERYEARVAREEYKDNERKARIEEMNQVSIGEKRLKNSLKDPSSADIRNSRLGKSGVTCGEVNAKNSFGAFTGYKNFIQIGSTTLIDDGSSEFAKEWNEMCR